MSLLRGKPNYLRKDQRKKLCQIHRDVCVRIQCCRGKMITKQTSVAHEPRKATTRTMHVWEHSFLDSTIQPCIIELDTRNNYCIYGNRLLTTSLRTNNNNYTKHCIKKDSTIKCNLKINDTHLLAFEDRLMIAYFTRFKN